MEFTSVIKGENIVKKYKGFEYQFGPKVKTFVKPRQATVVDLKEAWIKEHAQVVDAVEGARLSEAQIREQATNNVKKKLETEAANVASLKAKWNDALGKLNAEKAKTVVADDELVKKFVEKNGAREDISGKVETELKEGLSKLFERGSKKGGRMAAVIGGGAALCALIGLACRPKAKTV